MHRGLYAFNAIIWSLFDQIGQNLISRNINHLENLKMAKVGRPKGSGNKPLKRLLAERLSEKYPDFDPVIEMIEGSIKIKEIAETTGELSDYKSAVESFDRVSKYIQPTLKATELTTDGGLTVSVQRKRFDGSSNGTDNAD
jgi:hypothetical protein